MANDKFLKIGADGQPFEYKSGHSAGEALTAGNVVYLKSDGKLWKAKASEIAFCKTIMGIVAEDALLNAPVFLHTDGETVPANVSLQAGTIYFLSATQFGGVQTQVPGSGEVVVRLGYTDDAKRFFIKIDPPLIRDGGSTPDPVDGPVYESVFQARWIDGGKGQYVAQLNLATSMASADARPIQIILDGVVYKTVARLTVTLNQPINTWYSAMTLTQAEVLAINAATSKILRQSGVSYNIGELTDNGTSIYIFVYPSSAPNPLMAVRATFDGVQKVQVPSGSWSWTGSSVTFSRTLWTTAVADYAGATIKQLTSV